MKRCVGIAIVITVFFVVHAWGQSPALFPGSIPAGAGAKEVYLTRASLDEVVAFYRRSLGEPEIADNSAYFEYDRRQVRQGVVETTGVLVSRAGSNEGSAREVFARLRSLVQHGALDNTRYESLVGEFGDLQAMYFRDDGSGRRADTVVWDKYNQIVQTGSPMSQREMEEQMMELVAAGDHDGLLALSEELQRGAELAMRMRRQPALQVDHWIECLREIRRAAERNAYPVRIEMRDVRTVMESGFKG